MEVLCLLALSIISTASVFFTSETISNLLSILNLVFFYVLIYSMRSSLRSIINKNNNMPINIGPILTFFFSIIYLQYKMNEAIDQQIAAQG